MVTNLEKYGTKKWVFVGTSEQIICSLCSNLSEPDKGFTIFRKEYRAWSTPTKFCSMECVNKFLPMKFEGYDHICDCGRAFKSKKIDGGNCPRYNRYSGCLTQEECDEINKSIRKIK